MSNDHPAPALLSHADGRDTLEFAEDIRHGRMIFRAGAVVKFTDPAAAAYFDVAFNGTEFTDKDPHYTVTDEELNFDPDDPSGNETIDVNTKIVGRIGVEHGATVAEHLAGEPATAGPELEPHDVTSGSESDHG